MSADDPVTTSPAEQDPMMVVIRLHRLSQRVLHLLHTTPDLDASLREALRAIREELACDAAGIRLERNDDFPYICHYGFSEEFLAKENALGVRDPDGGVCRNEDGSLRLECTCGLVLSGKTDPAVPLFTPGGSFLSNDTVPLLDLPPEADPRQHPRNTCIHAGFASVALIPVFSGERIVGLLQLNDRRKGFFPPAAIQILEELAQHIGAAIHTRLVEQTLCSAQTRFHAILEGIPDGFFALDGKFRVSYFNPAAERLLGRRRAEVLGRPLFDAFPEARGSVFEERYRQALRERRPVVFETRFESPPYTNWYEVRAYPVPGGLAVAFQVITERKLADEALRRSEAEKAAILAASRDILFAVDRDCRIRFISRVPDGLTVAEALGTDATAYVQPEYRDRVRATIRRVFDTGQPDHYEIQARGAHDAVCRYESQCARYDATPEERLVLVCTRDITQRRILEDRLRQSEKLTAIGELAGGLAHDFRNQLAGIQGLAELIMDHAPADSPLAAHARDITAIVRRSADLTTNMLAFARKGKNTVQVVDLHEIIADAVRFLERGIDKRIALRRDLGASTAAVLGDRSQLTNALLNLGLNARDAIAGTGELLFRTRTMDLGAEEIARRGLGLRPGAYVELAVRDTGHGMDEATRQRVFEPFFTTKAPGKGTGLGLAAVHGIVTNHDGAVTVESAPGAGTTFILLLPAVERRKAPAAPAQPALRRGHGTLLVVDDEEILLNSLAFALEGLGYTPVSFTSAAAALAHYREHWRGIDLALLDMTMPETSGKDLYLEMRRVNPQVKALIMSGYAMDGEIQASLDAGANGYLEKPFTRESASEVIAKALGR